MQEVLDELLFDYPIPKRMLTYMLSAYEGLPPRLLSTQPHNIETLKYMILGGLSPAHQMNQVNTVMHRMSLKGGNATLPIKLHERLFPHIHLNKVLRRVIGQGKR